MEQQEFLTALTEMRTKMEADLKAQLGAMETKTTALQGDIETKMREINDLNAKLKLSLPGTGAGRKSLGQQVVESEQFKTAFGKGWNSGRARIPVEMIHHKADALTTTTVGGYGTPGVLPYESIGYIEPARQRLFIRDLIPSLPTSASIVQAIRQASFTSAASPQVEGSAKGESAASYEADTWPVQVLAHWITATRQVLEDMPELMSWINNDLMYYLKLKEESEILAGDHSGNHLEGLLHVATAFDTTLLGSGSWNKADVLRRAIQQLEIAYYNADGLVLHPTDWADLEVTKTAGTSSSGEYVIGDPKSSLPPSLWGKRIVVTPAITSGTFLAGAFGIGAQIRDRATATIDISTEHSTYFTENKVAIRCEERLALVTKHPGAFVTGSFSTSPA